MMRLMRNEQLLVDKQTIRTRRSYLINDRIAQFIASNVARKLGAGHYED